MSVLQVQEIEYPESDGEPLADNTVQYRLLTTIKAGLDSLFREDPLTFVAGDLLWYPTEGDNKICVGPDVMVALGRPKGDRGSYRQWEEGNVPPQVVFEILSPSNRPGNMAAKREFYRRFGVREYYEYDPEELLLRAWHRSGNDLVEITVANPVPVVSPLLGISLRVDGDLIVAGPDGRAFIDPADFGYHLRQERRAAQRQQILALQREDQARAQADDERRQRAVAEAKAADEQKKREAADATIAALHAKLRALGIDPETPTT